MHEPAFPICCALCGVTFSKMITHSHLRAAHNTTIAAYRSAGHPVTNLDFYREKGANQTGDRHPLWKGGRHRRLNGYYSLWINGKLRLEHRVIMERALGRKLLSNEVVHHRDGDKANNSLENLELITRSIHTTHHLYDRHAGKVTDRPCDHCGQLYRTSFAYMRRRQARYSQLRFFCSRKCAKHAQDANASK
jgi:hypothetical protein